MSFRAVVFFAVFFAAATFIVVFLTVEAMDRTRARRVARAGRKGWGHSSQQPSKHKF